MNPKVLNHLGGKTSEKPIFPASVLNHFFFLSLHHFPATTCARPNPPLLVVLSLVSFFLAASIDHLLIDGTLCLFVMCIAGSFPFQHAHSRINECFPIYVSKFKYESKYYLCNTSMRLIFWLTTTEDSPQWWLSCRLLTALVAWVALIAMRACFLESKHSGLSDPLFLYYHWANCYMILSISILRHLIPN